MSNKTVRYGDSEEAFIQLLRQGDEDAFRSLLDRYQTRLLRIAYGITLDREESLDIVQEVFLKVFRKIGTFRGDSSISTWLYRITINNCFNLKRRWKRRHRGKHFPFENSEPVISTQLDKDALDPYKLLRGKEVLMIIKQGLANLPEEARTVFVLKEIEGLSYDEIARVLKIKKGTVSSRLFYTRKRLRESLDEDVNNRS